MDRRNYGEQSSFFASRVHGSSYHNRPTDDDLVARSKEWMSRPERDRDTWRRSVDDFLDKPRYYRRDRSRSRSREREWDRRRDRSRERHYRKMSPDGEERDRRYKKYSREGSEENRPWSSEEENSNSYKSEHDFDDRGDGPRPDRFAYKQQAPQRTIIIRGMAQHITEVDIQDDIASCGLACKDIRLVRRKDTGTSRGFAFVEFNSVEEATRWMEAKQGQLMLKDHFRALLQYSLPKDKPFVNGKWLTDWICKCEATNFRRRETCYMCNTPRKEGEIQQEEIMEISTHPTNTVLLRGLDTLTTEENVLHSIKTLSSLPIRSVRIGRDAVTGTSRGVCYLEMNNVVDAMYLHNTFQSTPPLVDGKTPKLSYARLDPVTLHSSAAISGQIANAAVAAAQWSHQTTSSSRASNTTPTVYKSSDVPRLAEYSASLYATNPHEKTAYLAYYEDYYKKQVADGQMISLPINNANGLANAQAAMAAHKKTAVEPRVPLKEAPDGSGSATYSPPDTPSFQFDNSSGYFYDPYTTLYYDANSQYYYNNKIQKFLYWDASKETFLLAPSGEGQGSDASQPAGSEPKEDDKKYKEKEGDKDKVKVAKRIAKDMERWAKTLNQKKEIAKQNVVAQANALSSMKAVGAADIGFAVLERKDKEASYAMSDGLDELPSKVVPESLVAAYGQGSDSDDDEDQDDKLLTDWSKNVCLLCKRQFGNRDTLVKHQQMSDLHKQNLAAWYQARGLDPEDQAKNRQYRDRAKERRLKYGEPDKPQPSRLKESYIKSREAVSYEEPTKAGIGSDNLGNKLLQKMGWSEGMGLGKKNQGRTSIIQAERRSATAGLGTKSVGVTPGPGESYKDCVKKMMAIRYQELSDPS